MPLKVFKEILYSWISNQRLLDFSRSCLFGKTLVLMYHEVAEDRDSIEAWTVVRKSDFVSQMEYLAANFEVVSLRDALSGKVGRSDKPLAVVTFDDGYAGNKRTMLPVANAMGLPVTIFIATGAVANGGLYWYDRIINATQGHGPVKLDLNAQALGAFAINRTSGAENWAEIERMLRALKTLEPAKRTSAVENVLNALEAAPKGPRYALEHLSADDIREMAENGLVTFGAHSHCHSLLPQLADDEMRESVLTSRSLLEEWTGAKVEYFAYPSGAYDVRAIEVLKDNGFRCGLTTKCKPWEHESFFEIPRIGVGRYDCLDLFKIKVSNALNLFKAG
ncbi:MAG: polysaccharide deacetylase family protein [Deltaproteobacteria bacterium]|nr:polysaccharide deacetylase family protein [Deltaproteobacteria bacterium]